MYIFSLIAEYVNGAMTSKDCSKSLSENKTWNKKLKFSVLISEISLETALTIKVSVLGTSKLNQFFWSLDRENVNSRTVVKSLG